MTSLDILIYIYWFSSRILRLENTTTMYDLNYFSLILNQGRNEF